MFDWKKPTVQMLGRWQPWHQGHQELFKRCVAKTGQVIIQVRDVQEEENLPVQTTVEDLQPSLVEEVLLHP